ncbi:AAEL000218-PA [Aedes aegypti]|uniref:AAEL000218-PA n=1 Tax=Aedes aegypti TaxID=7159 RepID=Q17PU9_AEDAE|nr:AAEL000218-PA [Aedes aegypti]
MRTAAAREFNRPVCVLLTVALCATPAPVGSFDVPPNNNYIQTIGCSSAKKSAVAHKKITTAPNRTSFNWTFSKMTCTIALNGGVFFSLFMVQGDNLKIN